MGNLLDIIDKLDIKYIDSFAKELSLTGCTGGGERDFQDIRKLRGTAGGEKDRA